METNRTLLWGISPRFWQEYINESHDHQASFKRRQLVNRALFFEMGRLQNRQDFCKRILAECLRPYNDNTY